MHELDGDMAGVGARRTPRAERDEAPAANEALRHQVAEARDRRRLCLEETLARLGSRGQQALDRLASAGAGAGGRRRAAGRGRDAQAATASRAATSRSHVAKASTPSPVFALTSICGTPGWTVSRW